MILYHIFRSEEIQQYENKGDPEPICIQSLYIFHKQCKLHLFSSFLDTKGKPNTCFGI